MIRGVLFDLDGTVLDSAPDLVGALNELRARYGLDALAVEKMQQHAARGALGLLQAGMPTTDPETLERWRADFLELYGARSFSHSGLYNGVSEVLDHLVSNKIPWGIVTNKPEFLTVPILSAAGLADTISSLVCGDSLEQKKPHPAPVMVACRNMGVEPEFTLFVGDDSRDMEAGIAAGTQTCAALYGYGSAEMLQPEHRDLLKKGFSIQAPAELLDFLQCECERKVT